MVCQACGNPLEAGVHFCPRCGAQIAAAPPPAYPSPYPPFTVAPEHRVRRNLQTLGILWCIFGAYRVLAGLIGIFVLGIATSRSFGGEPWMWRGHFHGPFAAPWFTAPWMAALLPVVAVVSVAAALLAFLVAFGLMTRQPWGRAVGIIVAILSLWKFPFGTALGIYTLWVLVPAESGMEYDAIAGRI